MWGKEKVPNHQPDKFSFARDFTEPQAKTAKPRHGQWPAAALKVLCGDVSFVKDATAAACCYPLVISSVGKPSRSGSMIFPNEPPL